MKQIFLTTGLAVMLPQYGAAQSIDFGDDDCAWAEYTKCDDNRFEGSGLDGIQPREDIDHDPSDCRALCMAGEIALREY